MLSIRRCQECEIIVGKPFGKINKAQLIQLLVDKYPQYTAADFERDDVRKPELLIYAYRAGVISKEQLDEETKCPVRARKCQLSTFAEENVAAALRRLVSVYSLHHTRAYKLLNFLAATEFQIPLNRCEAPLCDDIQCFDPAEPIKGVKSTLYSKIFESGPTPLLLKQLLCIEKYSSD